IGLTIVAIGTSLPELASALLAATTGNEGIAVGTIVGSNIANIGLVLGLGALLVGVMVGKRVFEREVQGMFLVTFVFFVFCLDGVIGRIESLILLISFVAYILILFKFRFRFEYLFNVQAPIRNLFNVFNLFGSLRKNFKRIFVVELEVFAIGLIGLYLGARLLVDSSIAIALFFHIPESIIGLSMIAIGTSLPELMVSFSSIRKGLTNVLLGNIIGSNITNILLVVGAVGLIAPLNVPEQILSYFNPFLLIISAFFLLFVWRGFRVGRKQGLALILLYALFIYSLVSIS
ncbi:MAG: calcium/sodium antiporter, partial [archaeon]